MTIAARCGLRVIGTDILPLNGKNVRSFWLKDDTVTATAFG
jgi:hypothetical protein